MKIIKKILIVILTLFVAISSFTFYNQSRFKVKKINTKSKFTLTSILPIEENSVNYLNEIYDDRELIGFDCIKENSYYIKVLKIGKTKNNIVEIIKNSTDPLKISFNIFQSAFFPPNNKAKLQSSYNVEKLQNNDITQIIFHTNGNILKEQKINKNLVICEFIGSQFSFALNEDPYEIFDMLGIESKNQILFCKDSSNNVFFGYITTLPKNENLELDGWLK
jgi:hypothetical protein